MKRFGQAMMVLVGLAMLVLGCPFSSNNYIEGSGGAGAGAGGSGGAQTGCKADGECDDQNPCTKDTCKADAQCHHQHDNTLAPMMADTCNSYSCFNGEAIHVINNDMPCGSSPLKCNAAGQCAGCTSDAQCPKEVCRDYACNASMICTPSNKAKGTAVPDPTKGDCKGLECDGSGAAIAVVDATDVPLDDGDPCTDETCVATEPAHPLSAAGTGCPGSNGDEICDGTGNCFSCTDGILNGDEKDTDCGGSCPKMCNGDACSVSGTNGDCKSTHCVDGVCCNNACATTCHACNVLGSAGMCAPVPAGIPDIDTCPSQPNSPKACNGAGNCKKGLGATCGSGNECFNNGCVAGACRLSDGAPCTSPVACVSGSCQMGECAPCQSSGDCTSGVCMGSMCKSALGAPCSSGDCAQGSCMAGLCKLQSDAACTSDTDCFTGLCDSMTLTCVECNSATCHASLTCKNDFGFHHCLLAADAYCTANSQCNSNMCAGFPRTCQ